MAEALKDYTLKYNLLHASLFGACVLESGKGFFGSLVSHHMLGRDVVNI